MKHAEIEMHFVTPAFLSGADQKEAEFRAPSVRGLLRWWTRALGYAELEKTLFGSAGDKEDSRRSAVMIRDTTRAVIPSLFPKGGKLFSSYILWPYEEKRQGAQKFYSRKCIAQGARVSFSIQVRKKGV